MEMEQKKVKAEIVKHGGDGGGAESGEKTSNPEQKLKDAEAAEKKRTCKIF